MNQPLSDTCPLCKQSLTLYSTEAYRCLNYKEFIVSYNGGICIYVELRISKNKFCRLHYGGGNFMSFRNNNYSRVGELYNIPKIDWSLPIDKIINKIKLLLVFQ